MTVARLPCLVLAGLIVVVALVAAIPAAAAPRVVRLNDIQVVGSHNSYHVEPAGPEKALRAGSGLIDETTLEYSWAPLAWQLDREDVRQLELDSGPRSGGRSVRHAAPARAGDLGGPLTPAPCGRPASRSCTSRTTTTARLPSLKNACVGDRGGRTPTRARALTVLLELKDPR